MKKLLLLLVTCVAVLQCSHGQDSLRLRPVYLHSGKIGLGLEGITGSPNLLMKCFLNNQLAIQVLFGIELDLPGGSTPSGLTKVNGLTARGGLSLLVHLTQDQVSPYVGVEGAFQSAKAGGFFTVVPDPKNSFIGSGVLGAEYFINERFTIGIKQALGAEVSLKRDTPHEETEIKFNTSTVFTGRFYFN